MTPRMVRADIRTLLVLVLALAFVHGEAGAQYYEEPEYTPGEARYLYVGATAINFAPLGSNVAPDSERISFAKIMPMIGFRQGPVDLFIGYTKFDQHGKSNTAIVVGTVVSNEFAVSGRRGNGLMIPVMVAADYTKAESGGPERENFNIASLGLGAGLSYRLTSRSVDLSVRAGELFQFATEGLSTGSGFSAATVADASLVLHELVLNGIALGYRFRYQTWSMSDARFNYRAVSHGPYLGILF